jgi:hypothetical protein
MQAKIIHVSHDGSIPNAGGQPQPYPKIHYCAEYQSLYRDSNVMTRPIESTSLELTRFNRR